MSDYEYLPRGTESQEDKDYWLNFETNFDLPVVPQYSHRNGETEPPTEPAFYWIEEIEEGEVCLYIGQLVPHWKDEGKLEWFNQEPPNEFAKYWGPIPEPRR